MRPQGKSKRFQTLLGVVAVAMLVSAQAHSKDSTIDAGRDVAQMYCSTCHAIGRTDMSPLPRAPAFRTLHLRYPVESLSEALAEGILVGHPEMPKFALDPTEVHAFIAYLKSLERKN